MEMNGTIKGTCPILHPRIIMRVRDRDRAQTAQGANERDGRFIQQADTVPQDITLRRPQQQRALADAELRMGMDFEQVCLQLPPGVVLPFAWVRIVGTRALFSGHCATNQDGSFALPLGKVGLDVSQQQAYEAARLAGLAEG